MKELKGTALDYILQRYFSKELTEIEAIIEISKFYNIKKAPLKSAEQIISNK
ncbi:hypothetical protein [Vallitalea guaymasensis]|uniref:hypothetical protein n=1 Tax=Vallitalea guaymasensis TaxID=1185412 RepID=UPI00187D2788|nr:hypothetical protein [Vallitalea guaymasensis]